MHTVRNRVAVHNRAKPLSRIIISPPDLRKSTIPDMPPFMFGAGMSSVEPHVVPFFPAEIAISRPPGIQALSIPMQGELALRDGAAEEAAAPTAKPVRKRKAVAKTGRKIRKKAKSRAKAKSAQPNSESPKSRIAKPRSPKGLSPATPKVDEPGEANPRKRKSLASTKPVAAAPELAQPASPVSPIPAPVAISLPREVEPLTMPPVQPAGDIPLPRSVALTHYRKGSFLDVVDMVGFWLRDATRRTAARLLPRKQGTRRKLVKRPAEHQPAPLRDDLAMLRAENERLRRQLEAVQTRQEALARQEGQAE